MSVRQDGHLPRVPHLGKNKRFQVWHRYFSTEIPSGCDCKDAGACSQIPSLLHRLPRPQSSFHSPQPVPWGDFLRPTCHHPDAQRTEGGWEEEPAGPPHTPHPTPRSSAGDPRGISARVMEPSSSLLGNHQPIFLNDHERSQMRALCS